MLPCLARIGAPLVSVARTSCGFCSVQRSPTGASAYFVRTTRTLASGGTGASAVAPPNGCPWPGKAAGAPGGVNACGPAPGGVNICGLVDAAGACGGTPGGVLGGEP